MIQRELISQLIILVASHLSIPIINSVLHHALVSSQYVSFQLSHFMMREKRTTVDQTSRKITSILLTKHLEPEVVNNCFNRFMRRRNEIHLIHHLLAYSYFFAEKIVSTILFSRFR